MIENRVSKVRILDFFIGADTTVRTVKTLAYMLGYWVARAGIVIL